MVVQDAHRESDLNGALRSPSTAGHASEARFERAAAENGSR
jgi:hypothetical protein